MYEQTSVLLNALKLSDQAQDFVKRLDYAHELSAERELANALLSRECYQDLAQRASETAYSNGESAGFETAQADIRDLVAARLHDAIADAIPCGVIDHLSEDERLELYALLDHRVLAALFPS
jgi:flagellar biosynthesis/type III secretory pathway protein FliH